MKTVAEFVADWKVYGDTEDFVAQLWHFQSEAFAEGVTRANEDIKGLMREIARLENALQKETAYLEWLLPRQHTLQTRESIHKEIEDFHARNASPF